jgi:hypothetical protein
MVTGFERGVTGRRGEECRHSMTGPKKHRFAIPTDDDRRQKTIVCPTSGGSFS